MSIYTFQNTPFSIETETKPNQSGTWNSTIVKIYKDEKYFGEYERNYPLLATKTFYPFMINNQWYCLYSRHYTGTRVAKLETHFEDWCGEEPGQHGFCPAEYYVPMYNFYKDKTNHFFSYKLYDNDCKISKEDFSKSTLDPNMIITEFHQYEQFGFMSGCVWGDDTSWKLRYIDLSKIEEKQLVIDSRFGYFELPDRPLRECIQIDEFDNKTFRLIQYRDFNNEQLKFYDI